MKSQYSELNFGLGETLDMLREQVNSFAATEIAPAPRKSIVTTSSPWTCGENLAIWACWVSL